MSTRLPVIALIALALLLGACTSAPKTLQIARNPDARDGPWPVWPRAAEVPRFVYVGDLTGEENFVDAEAELRSGGQRLLAWIVGLGQEERVPVVLRRPQGVTEDERGRIWVTDVSRRAVFLFDADAGELQVFEAAVGGDRFVAPIAVAALPDGEMLVSDAELGYVVRLDAAGKPIGAIGRGTLQRPTGVAVDRLTGRIFVADTRRNAIQVFAQGGEPLYSFGAGGEADGELNSPTYLSCADGLVYVTDTLNARVQVFRSDGSYLRQFGKRGLYVGNFVHPKGVAADESGLVYVVESYFDHLLVFDRAGNFLLPVGGAGHRPGEFFLPAGVYAGRGGRIYVADMFNGRVSIFQFLGEAL